MFKSILVSWTCWLMAAHFAVFVFIIGIKCNSLAGQHDDCTEVTCESFSRKLNKCTVDGVETITRVPITQLFTSNACNFHDGPPESDTDSKGSYGFEDNYIWVHNGCRAIFTVCGDTATSTTISESLITAFARSTKLKSTSLGQQLTTTRISASDSSILTITSGKLSSPAVTSISDMFTPTPAYTKTALQLSQKDESSLKVETVVGATVGGGVGLVVLGGGAYLLNSWVTRNRVSPLIINRNVDI